MSGPFDDLLRQVEGLLPEIDDLIKDVPVDLAGNFEERRDKCLDEPITSRYQCLYALFQDIKKAIRNGDDKRPPPTPTTDDKKPKEEFPWIWVAAGGVALAAVVFALTRKG